MMGPKEVGAPKTTHRESFSGTGCINVTSATAIDGALTLGTTAAAEERASPALAMRRVVLRSAGHAKLAPLLLLSPVLLLATTVAGALLLVVVPAVVGLLLVTVTLVLLLGLLLLIAVVVSRDWHQRGPQALPSQVGRGLTGVDPRRRRQRCAAEKGQRPCERRWSCTHAASGAARPQIS
jgi:hypothetical protein